ncbi:MAG: energy transducer TonB, partial [Bacteroidota bacterium]
MRHVTFLSLIVLSFSLLLAASMTAQIVDSVHVYPPIPPPPPPPPEEEEVYKIVEHMPRFPGCEDKGLEEERKACSKAELLKFVYKNLVYPDSARQASIEGTVVVQFIIEKDGSVSSEKIVHSLGYGCDEEALRIVSLMRDMGLKWTGQRSRGRP